MFNRVLVANRGEIALRVIRSLNTLGIESVAIYSDADVTSLHARSATKSFNLPGVYPSDTYLNKEKIIEIARKTDCDAIHPGYGFLSENDEFSRLCRSNSLKFIGPKPETLEISGNKLECKKLAESKGVPVIPYSKEPVEDQETAVRVAGEIGFPVLLKSAFGGGGRGIKEARSKQEVRDAFESSEREARSAFGRFALYLEKKIVRPRHIEVQILANDSSTEYMHLGERECSIQRRYQKLVELSPSPVVGEKERKLICDFAIRVARAIKYSNAGTIEFLRDSSGDFYFIEVNSRLQVEHPVTEAVTGVDLVQSQLLISSRKSASLPLRQRQIQFRGTAIECRINAEDPLLGFLPQSGRIDSFRLPGGPGVRVDSALFSGMEVPPYYDSLIAKLICWGESFDNSRDRCLVALDEFKIAGVKTTIDFHRTIISDRQFARGIIDTSFIEKRNVIAKLRDSRSSHEDQKYVAAALVLSELKSRQSRERAKKEGSFRALDQLNSTEVGRFIDGI